MLESGTHDVANNPNHQGESRGFVVSTYKENRRENLIALERKFGSLEALSDAVNVSASYLSQMKNTRHMGDKIARRFERKLGLPAGSMDTPPGAPMAAVEKPIGGKMSVPHYSPNERVQEFLNDYLEVPVGLQNYLRRKVRELKLYTDKLTPFQRNNFPEPPVDPTGYEAWERELEAELRSIEAPAERKKLVKAGK